MQNAADVARAALRNSRLTSEETPTGFPCVRRKMRRAGPSLYYRRKLTRSKFQKESLSEYGSGWGWDEEYAHVFDNEAFEDVPTRYKKDGTGDNKETSQNNCLKDISNTDGQLLFSGARRFRKRMRCAR